MPYATSVALRELAPRSYAAIVRASQTTLEEAVDGGVPAGLAALVWLRVSLQNGCSFCIHQHRAEAAEAGEPASRLDAVAAWEASDLFDPRERAALTLADALTRQAELSGIAPEAIDGARAAWGEAATAHLVMLATSMIALNRLGVAGGLEPPVS